MVGESRLDLGIARDLACPLDLLQRLELDRVDVVRVPSRSAGDAFGVTCALQGMTSMTL
jgi:hypothetical protein